MGTTDGRGSLAIIQSVSESAVHAQQIISTHPQVQGSTNEALIACIEACYDCSQACTACADACLGEKMVADMVQCIRTCLDCADACAATGQIASRRTGSNEQGQPKAPMND